MLDAVADGGDGITGIGVLPGPLRKLLGVDKPFVRPADFAGTTVGMQDSGVAERTFAALGAGSLALPSGEKDLSAVDAYEQQLQSIWGNQYQQDAGYLTANLDLWPRPLVLFANDESLTDLDDDQRDALLRGDLRSSARWTPAARTTRSTSTRSAVRDSTSARRPRTTWPSSATPWCRSTTSCAGRAHRRMAGPDRRAQERAGPAPGHDHV